MKIEIEEHSFGVEGFTEQMPSAEDRKELYSLLERESLFTEAMRARGRSSLDRLANGEIEIVWTTRTKRAHQVLRVLVLFGLWASPLVVLAGAHHVLTAEKWLAVIGTGLLAILALRGVRLAAISEKLPDSDLVSALQFGVSWALVLAWVSAVVWLFLGLAGDTGAALVGSLIGGIGSLLRIAAQVPSRAKTPRPWRTRLWVTFGYSVGFVPCLTGLGYLIDGTGDSHGLMWSTAFFAGSVVVITKPKPVRFMDKTPQGTPIESLVTTCAGFICGAGGASLLVGSEVLFGTCDLDKLPFQLLVTGVVGLAFAWCGFMIGFINGAGPGRVTCFRNAVVRITAMGLLAMLVGACAAIAAFFAVVQVDAVLGFVLGVVAYWAGGTEYIEWYCSRGSPFRKAVPSFSVLEGIVAWLTDLANETRQVAGWERGKTMLEGT